MKEPSLDDLRVFLAVACEGSLNAAATALSASPATLSRRISQLEKETGRTLFHRQPSGQGSSSNKLCALPALCATPARRREQR